MDRTFLAALVAAPVLLACAQRPQSSTTLAPERAPRTVGRGVNTPHEASVARRAYPPALEGIVLTSKQWARIDQIREKYRIRAQSLDPRDNPEDRELAAQLMRSQLDELRAVLTPEQHPAFDRNIEAIRNRGPRRGLARADR